MSRDYLEGEKGKVPDDGEILRGCRGWFFGLGLALIVLGIAATSLPVFVALTIDLILGAILVICGIAHVGHAIMSRK